MLLAQETSRRVVPVIPKVALVEAQVVSIMEDSTGHAFLVVEKVISQDEGVDFRLEGGEALFAAFITGVRPITINTREYPGVEAGKRYRMQLTGLVQHNGKPRWLVLEYWALRENPAAPSRP